MTVACAAPDPSLGVALRLSTYLDCQARALGENGYQAFAGGPVAAGLLSGLVTIFVALIGYRLILGDTPGLRDGIGLTSRLGMVLALATGWPAFQTLAYDVAVDGPGELAAIVLPASGLPADGLAQRVQQEYDLIRLGPTQGETPVPAVPPSPASDAQAVTGQPTSPSPPRFGFSQVGALPQTASVLVTTTIGVTGALALATGFLLAVGPLGIMGLLFDATVGLFSGWVRALAGAALALAAATVVTAVELVVVDGELAHVQDASIGAATLPDPQALTTIVLLFAVVMIVSVMIAARMAGAFRLPTPLRVTPATLKPPSAGVGMATVEAVRTPTSDPRLVDSATASRVRSIADALAISVRREQVMLRSAALSALPVVRRTTMGEAIGPASPGLSPAPLGLAGRRTSTRRTHSASRRDRLG